MKLWQSRAEYVRELLLRDLRSGKYAIGNKIPSEDELAEKFEVSRATIREAVQALLEAGLLSRRHGYGTFVTGLPHHRHSLDSTVSYTAMIREAGMQPSETVVSRTSRAATAEEADRLNIEPGEMLICIERVRAADGTPVIYSEDRIPEALLRDLSSAPLDTSLYDLLNQAGITIHRAFSTLRPVVAGSRLAALLGVARGSALQYIDQVDYTERGVGAMVSSEWHVPGVFELYVNRRSSTLDSGR